MEMKLALLINFTKEEPGVELRGSLIPSKSLNLKINEDQRNLDLIFTKKSLSFTSGMLLTEDDQSVREMGETSAQVSKAIGFIGNILSGFLGFSLFFGFGASTLAKLMRLFEVINR